MAGCVHTGVPRSVRKGRAMLKRWVIGKMDVWHESPRGGRCPAAGTPAECSRYGVRAVSTYGALVGVLLAARHVSRCRPSLAIETPFECKWGLPPDKFSIGSGWGDGDTFCPKGSYGTLGALLLFMRLAMNEEFQPLKNFCDLSPGR